MTTTKTESHPKSLMAQTLVLLNNHPLSLIDVHTHTGINYYWLKKFSAGEFKDPSVNRVQALFEFLSGRDLNVE